jgi:hypothetical protein
LLLRCYHNEVEGFFNYNPQFDTIRVGLKIEIGGRALSLSLSIKKESPTKGVVVYMYSILSLIGLDSKVSCPRRTLVKGGRDSFSFIGLQ